ncbi:MAG: ABC transporter permease [Oscillospiraceae bacterium]|nr:ABC transporter permease [Oscillospiraceae bacterium]
MKHTLRQVFHSSKFLVGFIIFLLILLTIWIYPFFNPGNPLEMIGVGTFARPGSYVSLYDALNTSTETLRLADADDKRLDKLLSDTDRISMLDWFDSAGVDVGDLDIEDTDTLLDLWFANYSSDLKPAGMTNAKRNYYKRLNNSLMQVRAADTLTITDVDEATGDPVTKGTVTKTDYVNIGQVANVKRLPLGTDNFGRDVLKELVSATGTSIIIGLIAGVVATLIGLTLGLLAGYVGGLADDIIMFITNIFTVIPSFVLLILISYSIGQEQRGASVVAIVIGFTSWTWTARSVRSQVISLRNRDHVNLSKLSGHSLVRIIATDILPYIASYVVMAFILQVSSGILSEAQLSLLGLGPKTTVTPTLGLMMNWAMLYSAHTNGSWWAYFPVILTITLISFSLNLMNTGLDQVFNPTLRD